MAGHSDNDLGLPEFADPVKMAIVIAPYYKAISEAQLASANDVGEVTTHFKAAVSQVAAGARAQAADTDQMAAAATEVVRAIDEIEVLSRDVGERARDCLLYTSDAADE